LKENLSWKRFLFVLCEIKRVEGYRAEGNDFYTSRFFYLSPIKVNQVENISKGRYHRRQGTEQLKDSMRYQKESSSNLINYSIFY